MTPVVLRREAAKRDLVDLFVYIGENHSIDRALRFKAVAEEAFRLLAENPLIGASRSFRNPAYNNVRLWPIRGYSGYLIFYRPIDNGIQIERVLAARTDYRRHLGPET